jgi:hypothetical protein
MAHEIFLKIYSSHAARREKATFSELGLLGDGIDDAYRQQNH